MKYDDAVQIIKAAILQSQYDAARSVNEKQLTLYYGIGKYISLNSRKGFWGKGAIDTISDRLQRELPGLRGFSARNLRNMRSFYEEWSMLDATPITADQQNLERANAKSQDSPILAVATAKSPDESFWQFQLPKTSDFPIAEFLGMGFTQHLVVLGKVKSRQERLFYIRRCAEQKYSVENLEASIARDDYGHQGNLPNNFPQTLPTSGQALRAINAFKDEYLLDFINVEELGARDSQDVDERVVENAIVHNVKNFILAFGKDFTFVRNQYHLDAFGEDQYIDLLFFNRELNCLVAVELKTGKFKTAYLGQLQGYLSVLDGFERKPHENPSIGLILCKDMNKSFVDYVIQDYSKPMGVATYKTADDMPEKLRKALPDVEALRRLLDGKRRDAEPLAREGQSLRDHIVETASLARIFAEPFGLEYLAYVCGLLHDLGKYSAAFQCYLEKALSGKTISRGEVPHAWEGAQAILRQLGEDRKTMGLADILANIVASHHGGLTDMIVNSERFMPSRINDHAKAHPEQVRDVMETAEVAEILSKIDWNAVRNEFTDIKKRIGNNSFALHLATKFLYSCLVDADRCNAAGMDNPDSPPDWDEMERCLDAKLKAFAETPEEFKSPLDKVRASISAQCAEQAARAPGVFTLSVPTGGGKTLSSLRFAIRHARANGLKRIVYVIPYLSIIDQTARDFRKILGNRADDWLLEHHSNYLVESGNEDDEKRYDLGTQRWDSPVIVTTMVQFLESVMSNKASDLRKFHNMTKSVFIFDEVQALPVACTHLFNATVNFLHNFGGSSCVLCSATQPAFAKVERPLHFSPSPDLVTLSDADKALFHRTMLINKTSPELTCEEIADLALSRFRQEKSTLVVVNTRDEARKVFNGLGKTTDRYFLSTDMCPAHRLDVIDRMRTALDPDCGDAARPILCVSTQLIEAGVDISFDCVIRAEAGFDSIVQVAGRCNRHGRSPTPQEVIIVRVKDEKLDNLDEIALGKELTARILRERLLDDETAALSVYYSYKFGLPSQKVLMDYPAGKDNPTLYDWLGINRRAKTAYADAHGDRPYPGLHSAFQSAAEHFTVIPGVHIGVVVPYTKPGAPDEVQSLVSNFLDTGERLRVTFDREARATIYRERSRILRHLQQYTVSVFPSREAAIQQMASKIDDAFYLLSPAFYDPVIGLTDEQGFLNG